jgi:peptidoglycan biosynthesis protein MviN/MurJ (putative lipid II flippase)
MRAVHPAHWRIARDLAWVSVFGLIGGLALVARDMAIAYRFGVSAVVDAYVLVFALIAWLPSVWTSVLTVVLVPLLVQMAARTAEDRIAFRGELTGVSVVIGGALTFMAAIALPVFLGLLPLGLVQPTLALAREFSIYLAPALMLAILAGLAFTRLLALGLHFNTLFQSIPAVIILLSVLVWPAADASALLWGTLVGYALLLVALGGYLHANEGLEKPRTSLHSPAWRTIWRGTGVMAAGQFLMSATIVVDQIMVAQLGEGAIATLGYASRVLAIALGLGSMAAARATLPVFSQAVATGQITQVRRQALRWTGVLFLLGLFNTLAGWLIAPWGVSVLFERGAFTPGDTVAVTEAFRYGLAQLPFYFAAIVLVQWLAAQGRHREIAASGLIGLGIKITANALLIPWLGVAGITLASALMYAGTFMFFAWLAHARPF